MGNEFIRFIKQSLLSVIYSTNENCIVCNSDNVNEKLVCSKCFSKIEFYNKSFTIKKDDSKLQCLSAAYYSTIIADLIKRLKYKSDFLAGEFLASLLIDLINTNRIEYNLISYIPMTAKALRKRGFNQSKFLASLISEHFEVKTEEILIKSSETKDQIGLNDENRWENLSSCFKVKNKSILTNKRILLIDDVITTGATSYYCANELMNKGAEKVTILTIAKSRL
ncbi:comF family protein [Clostridiales bacterium oral taxon 876 str. F0540]|nr:comF family protein [Clostridiales bacterium oral taxon 876 str. F0540]